MKFERGGDRAQHDVRVRLRRSFQGAVAALVALHRRADCAVFVAAPWPVAVDAGVFTRKVATVVQGSRTAVQENLCLRTSNTFRPPSLAEAVIGSSDLVTLHLIGTSSVAAVPERIKMPAHLKSAVPVVSRHLGRTLLRAPNAKAAGAL